MILLCDLPSVTHLIVDDVRCWAIQTFVCCMCRYKYRYRYRHTFIDGLFAVSQTVAHYSTNFITTLLRILYHRIHIKIPRIFRLVPFLWKLLVELALAPETDTQGRSVYLPSLHIMRCPHICFGGKCSSPWIRLSICRHRKHSWNIMQAHSPTHLSVATDTVADIHKHTCNSHTDTFILL